MNSGDFVVINSYSSCTDGKINFLWFLWIKKKQFNVIDECEDHVFSEECN